MLPDIENLLKLQDVDKEIRRLQDEVAELPKRVAVIEQKLAGTKTQLEKAQAAVKADEASRCKFETNISDLRGKISKYRDQSLDVKTNEQYKALLHEIQFAEQKIAASEDQILEFMVAADVRKEVLRKAEAELKADSAENDREKEEARRRTAADEKEMAELSAKRNQVRGALSEDVLRHYDRVLKLRGTALAAVYENQMCSACSVVLRPQVYQEVMTNQGFLTCDTCKRILYYVPPPPRPEDDKAAKAPVGPGAASPGDGAVQP